MATTTEARPTTERKSMLTVREVSQILNVTTKTIYEWVGDGKMPPPLRLNGVRRWRPEVIESWLADVESNR